MKLLKKLIPLSICCALIPGAAFAANGDVIGNIYSTDILTIVNGQPIESYNIGGKTLIIAEQLHEEYYGFAAVYNDKMRELHVSSYTTVYANKEIERGKVGKIAGNVYETDIKVFFNGNEITGYNIGGKTAVCVEDLGVGDTDEFGYTKYICKANWNSDTRTLTLDSVYDNTASVTLGGTPSILYGGENNVITAKYSPMNYYFSSFENFNITDEFKAQTYKLKPLYLDNGTEKMQVGVCFVTTIYDDDPRTMNFFDVQKMNALTNEMKGKTMAYDECLAFIEKNENYKIINQYENDKYMAVLIDDANDTANYKLAVLNKSGGIIELGFSTAKGKTVEMVINDENVLTVTVSPWDAKYKSMSYDTSLDQLYFGEAQN